MKSLKIAALAATAGGTGALVYPGEADRRDLPNRMPEAAPYVVSEAQAHPPPFEQDWRNQDNPGQCRSCHTKIFDEWNGSMMSNAWRDPIWRGAFLLLARSVSAHGNCDTPSPPDGTRKASLNPFSKPGECASEFDIGTGKYTVSRPGSLLDAFCSRCHMPSNYVDNVPLKNVSFDPKTGLEDAKVDPNFNPTADNGTGMAFATLDSQLRNTESGKSGIFCAVCHSFGATRDTPFHNYARSGTEYRPADGDGPRDVLLPPDQQDMLGVADPASPNLGYGIGAGSYRLSPHAIESPERFGPLVAQLSSGGAVDDNTSSVFGKDIPYQRMDPSKHKGFHQTMFVRSEMCAACHDVTNALPIKNALGKWVGGFPIERTYTEWSTSRYADRPGNTNFDPGMKRDCQSCHMQQDYGQPGTAQTLYRDGKPLPPPDDAVAVGGPMHPFFTHHFVGGNTFVPRLIGKDLGASSDVSPYPELSAASYSSADEHSIYSRAVWTHVERKGVYAQQQRLAWDRLQHVLSMDVSASEVVDGKPLGISITIANTGSGHDFPTGFPEGRTAWLALHAYDLATGAELPIYDSVWERTSVGVGNLTTEEMVDPNFPDCDWKIPAASADPYSVQFKAVASLGDGCPTLALPYATPLNLVTNAQGLPVDVSGRVIDARQNPLALPRFRDVNGNGDLFDDSFLRDTRFRPMPHPEATKRIDRYAVAVTPQTRGPIAVSAAVYYQTVEAVVAREVLGNLADTDNDSILEPCVLGGGCDGRKPSTEPPVVEGAPPVPMIVRDLLIPIGAPTTDGTPPRVRVYPAPGTRNVYRDAVIKASFSRPMQGLDARTFTLADSRGKAIPARVDQVGPGTWGLFPNEILLRDGETYTARVTAGVCDGTGRCVSRDVAWKFTVAANGEAGSGDTGLPTGFSGASWTQASWMSQKSPVKPVVERVRRIHR
jgi:hypothetical protein